MGLAGERIRECRLLYRLTQDDVGKHIGVGKQAVYKYEKGEITNIPLESIEKMAELFHCAPEYLAGWSDEGAPPDPLSSEEQYLVTAYRGLNQFGKQLMIDRAAELTVLYGEKADASGSPKIG